MSDLHNIYDTDLHFVIDPSTRSINNNSGKTTLVQYDHNSERFTFEISRMINGHDMSKSDLVQIHYLNTSATSQSTNNPGVYIVDDLQLSPDSDDVVIFSWLVSGNATKYVGKLDFNIRFLCDDGDGKPEYVWNTATHTGVVIISSIYNGDVVAEEYADVLAEWDVRLKVLEEANADTDTEQDISLDVPLVADYVQGEEAYLYPSGMVNTRNLDWHRDMVINQKEYAEKYIYGRERIEKVDTSAMGQLLTNEFILQKIADKTNVERIKNVVTNVWANPTNPIETKNVLILGDSYTAEKKWVDYFKTNHLDTLSNYNLIGSEINKLKLEDKNITTNNGVSYSLTKGMLTLNDTGDEKTALFQAILPLETSLAVGTYKFNAIYNNTGENSFALNINFYSDTSRINKVAGFTIYADDTYDKEFEITNADAIVMVVTATKDRVFNNVLVRFEIPNGMNYIEATGGYTWNNYVDNPKNLPSNFNINPFWTNHKIDIKNYVERRAGTGANLDYLICMLGINTRVNNAYWTSKYEQNIETAIDSITTLAPQLFEAVHTAYPECKILICGYPLPPFIDGVNNSKWELLFDRAEFLHRLNQTYTDFATQYDYVRFVHIASSVDSQKAFNVGDVTISNATYQMITTDDIHPSDTGYRQIADAVWRGFVGLTNM